MNTQTVKSTVLTNGRSAIDAMHARALAFKASSLPKAANAAEGAGKAIADAALSGTRSIAKQLRAQAADATGKKAVGAAALLQSLPFLRTAGRFARRNPALVIAAAGVAAGVIAYGAWHSYGARADELPEVEA